MSGQSESDGVLPQHTVSCKLEQETLVKVLVKELCGEEGEASVPQNAETIKIENNEHRKTEQDACSRTYLEIEIEAAGITGKVEEPKQEIFPKEENETPPSSPSSSSVVVLPNEDNAEKNANFDLVFPYGHEFMFEGEPAMAVLVEKHERSCQYEDYDEWLSRISKEHSLRLVRGELTNLRDQELRRQVASSQTNTTVNPVSSQKKNDVNQLLVTANSISSTVQHDIVSDITRSQESQLRLVVKKPGPIIESMTVKRSQIDHNYCLNSPSIIVNPWERPLSGSGRLSLSADDDDGFDSDKIEDDTVNIINASPRTNQNSKKLHQLCARNVETARHHNITDTINTQDSRPRLTVKKARQINEETANKELRVEHNFFANSDKVEDCNTYFNKEMDQKLASDDSTTALNQSIVKHTMRSSLNESRSRLTVKNPDQINKPTLQKRKRVDTIDCTSSEKNTDCNFNNINKSFVLPPSYQKNNIDQVCISDDITQTLHQNHEPPSTIVIASPKLTVCASEENIPVTIKKKIPCIIKSRDARTIVLENGVIKLHEPSPEKRMRRDHKFCGNSDKPKNLNVDNSSASQKDVSVTVKKIIPCVTKSPDNPTIAVKTELIQLNEPSPEKRMCRDRKFCGNSDKTKNHNVKNSSTLPTPHTIQDSKKITQQIDENIKKSHNSPPTLVIKKPKQIQEPGKIMLIDNNNVCKNSDTIRDCNINNTSSSPQKNDQVSTKKDEIIATLQNIALNIKKNRELRPRLVVKKSKLLKNPILNKKPQVAYYDKAVKTIDDCVKSKEGEAVVSNKDNFEWSTSMDSFRGIKESFAITQTGSVASHATIYDAFRAFWDDDILNTIARETNRHAKSASMSVPFKEQWYDTNMHEILILFAFWIMLGIIRMPTIKSCFSNDPLLKVNVFRTMFTKIRYDNLVTALSFASTDDNSDKTSELQCISPILDHLNAKFQSNFIPCQNISIDKSCLPSDDTHTVHTKTNTVNLGIKTLELCDNATGYLWSLLIHLEKNERENVESQPDSEVLEYNASVLKLIKPLLNKGYTLYLNILLNSPTLARFLKKNKTDCVGMLAPLSDGLPSFEGLANMRPRQFLAQHAKDVCVIAWYYKNIIYYISTYHSTGLTSISHDDEERGAKGWMPQVVIDCEKNLGVVSNKNQMLEPYVTERSRCERWHMKLFKRLLNFSVLNAQILLESSNKMKVDQLATRLKLVDSILEKHLCLSPASNLDSRQSSKLPPWREIGHWPVLYKLETTDTNRYNQSRCVYCFSRGFRNNKTRYKCEQCDVPLCVLCFKGYHSQSR